VLQKHIKQSPVLSLALSENVAFLKEEVLDAGGINLDKRTFRAKPKIPPFVQKPQPSFVYRGQDSISELYEFDAMDGDYPNGDIDHDENDNGPPDDDADEY
jgi:hypothetical protein